MEEDTGEFIGGGEEGIETVTGTGIITDNTPGIYKVKYAAVDNGANPQANIKFGYNIVAKTSKENEDGKYYFDRWMKMKVPALGYDDQTDYYATAENRALLAETGNEKRDYRINTASIVDDGTSSTGDFIYVAVYKPVTSSDVVRLDVKYVFDDYNTDDGNYVYDPNKALKTNQEYNKIIKVPFGTGTSYQNAAAVTTGAVEKAISEAPEIVSNYFDYTTANSAVTGGSNTKKVSVTVKLSATPHEYKIVVGKVSGSSTNYSSPIEGYYQQTVELKASDYGITSGNVYWYMKNGASEVVLGNESTYSARFIQSGLDNTNTTGAQHIYVKAGTKTVDKTSSIVNSYNETFNDGDTKKVRHNYYIVDFFNPTANSTSTLIGAGALVATATNGSYTIANNATVLGSAANREGYINTVLSGNYTTDRKLQTINNIGFRYFAYDSTYGRDKLRYSEQLKGYHYLFGVENAESVQYTNQTVRVYSYFIYRDSNGDYQIVTSDSYAELSRNP